MATIIGRFLLAVAAIATLATHNTHANSLCTPIPTGLISWWRAENTALDSSGDNNGITHVGIGYANGVAGTAFSFDGLSGMIEIPASSNLNVGSQSGFSIEAWINPSELGLQPLFEWNDGLGGVGAHLWISVDTGAPGNGYRNIYANIKDTNGNDHQLYTAAGLVSSNVFQHIALTYDKTTGIGSIYLNGQIVKTDNLGVFQPLTDAKFYFGERVSGPFSGIFFNGIIDEASLYSRALSSNEVKAIFMAAASGKCLPDDNSCTPPPADLNGFWKAEGDVTDSAKDNDGTIQGGVTFTNGVVGNGFLFNGTTGRILIPASSDINVGAAGGFSIEAWVNPASLGIQPLFEWNNGGGIGGVGAHLWISVDTGAPGNGYRNIYANIKDTNGNDHHLYTAAGLVSSNEFQHIALTYDKASGIGTIYLNGQIVKTNNLGTFEPFTAANFYLGERVSGPFSGIFFNGIIDEASLYSRALNATEVAAIFAAGVAGKCAAPTSPKHPEILEFDPVVRKGGEAVTIHGRNFSPVAGSNIVYFGGVRATVTAAATNSLTVIAPSNATYAHLTVTVGGLTAYSADPFLPTYLGSGTLNSSSLASRFEIPTGNQPYRLALADLDNDGKLDIVAIHYGSGDVRLYRNMSTNGNLSPAAFGSPVILPVQGAAQKLFGLAVGDLDHDGNLDIVTANTDLQSISIFRNLGLAGGLSSNSFSPRINVALPGGPRALAVADFNGDAKPEIAIALQTGNSVVVLSHTSPSGIITSNSFSLVGTFSTGSFPLAIATGDLDGDGKTDLVTANATGSSAALSILRNTSTLQAVAFAPKVNLPGADSSHVSIADLDLDGKPEIIGTMYLGQRMSVYRNLAGSGTITSNSFAPAIDFALGARGHTTAISDLDGDCKPDVLLVTELPSRLSVFKNQSTGTPFSAASLAPRVDFATGWNAWGVVSGDLNGDGRPDVAFANQYDSTISIYRNAAQNTPPVAVADAFTTAPNTPASFSTAKLLLNDLDEDGHPLTVTSTSTNSTQGGTVVLNADVVTYTPPAGFTGTDIFSYSVSDGHGGSAVVNVYATVGNGGPIGMNIVFGPLVIGGNFVVSFAGIPGLSYTIEAADAVNGPWNKVTNMTAPVVNTGSGAGVFQLSEPVGTNSTRFYRTVFPAY